MREYYQILKYFGRIVNFDVHPDIHELYRVIEKDGRDLKPL